MLPGKQTVHSKGVDGLAQVFPLAVELHKSSSEDRLNWNAVLADLVKEPSLFVGRTYSFFFTL